MRKHEKSWGVEASETRSKSLIWDDVVHLDISIVMNRKELTCHKLPLAVYREVMAHLRQVEGVTVGLISQPTDNNPESFDYNQSQIKSLWLQYDRNLPSRNKQRIEEILDYYAQRYNPWQEQ